MVVIGETIVKEGGDITYKDMIDEPHLEDSQIQKMFAGASVFITGGTGFLGKLFIDKLLRSSPGLRKLYVLVRAKKNKEPIKRLEEQLNDVLYDRLRKEQPDFIKKIYVVEGEVNQENLGISETDRQLLINEVDFIFHGAATVRFDEPLKVAVGTNVRGSREMLLLARSCTKLRAYVHISTAYSYCTQLDIDEKFYKSSLDGDQLIDLVENMDEAVLKDITPGLVGNYPNTYAYTKAAAEDVVLKHSKGLPVAMVRPSIVIATARDPIVGWIDNVYGPTGVVVGVAVGLLRVLLCNRHAVADLVPGDMVVNACIAAAWKTAKDYPGNHEDAPPLDQAPPVYNFVSSEENPLTWDNFLHLNRRYGYEVPTIQAVWHYILLFTTSEYLFNFYCLLLHWIPAYIIDGIAVLIGKKPVLKVAYQKIEKFSRVIGYFSCRSWKFSNQNVQSLYKELCDADKDIYDFNIAQLDWKMYFYNQVRGIRLYLLKDPMETVPQGLKRYFKLKVAHYFILAILGFIVFKLLSWIFCMFL
ncbi:fatty acyl-CoA reductase wat [Pieris rapae]|uniref:fatty acyl-CoA reductase wat n=1 Tax=Pieris rapae TaxID=64459 RepID=UPI001E27F4F0|nr:fatty acyl-CoA reductase wat [Pieris rapae]